MNADFFKMWTLHWHICHYDLVFRLMQRSAFQSNKISARRQSYQCSIIHLWTIFFHHMFRIYSTYDGLNSNVVERGMVVSYYHYSQPTESNRHLYLIENNIKKQGQYSSSWGRICENTTGLNQSFCHRFV